MIYRALVRCFSVALMMVLTLNWANAQDPSNGQTLFLANCAQCHNASMKLDMTGPALYGVQERWAKFPKDLYKWIRNSGGLVAEGQPYAMKIYNDWNKSAMQAFPNLTDENIDDILAFIQNKGEFGCATPPCAVATTDNTANNNAQSEAGGVSPAVLWTLLIMLLLAVVMLARYINSLNRLAQQKNGEEPMDEKSILDIILSPNVVRLLVFALVIVGGYTTVNNAIGLGRQQDYAPTQPIKFSHALHAGKNGIDCQYCHDGARRSKQSVIPAMNTCMNCHTAVQSGPEHGTAEILKIYASTGFNPISIKTPGYGAYFTDTVSVEKRLEIYGIWLKDANKAKNLGDAQLSAQLAAARPHIGKTIEWIRIHNLPDHAYFNHAQHVTVGKVACQTCHGKVEEMEVVKQFSPLSMGWCVNCHRQTKVQFNENGYYKSDDYKMYEKYHEEVKSGKRGGVTVEEIGGLECQKCHY